MSRTTATSPRNRAISTDSTVCSSRWRSSFPSAIAVPLPHKNFKEDHVVPLALRQLCGGVDLTGDDVDPPQIIGLVESKLGPLDITALTLNNDTGDSNPFFTWDDELGQWVYNIRTTQLGTGRFTLTIRIASRKEYAAAFILESERLILARVRPPAKAGGDFHEQGPR